MRVLLFACGADDARLMMIYSDRMEITYLPSYDLEEVRDEIERFEPKLVLCGADAFLKRLLSHSPSFATHSKQGESSISRGLSAEFVTPRNKQGEDSVSKEHETALVTPRETKVLAMLAQGKTNDEMAKALRLSTRTVKRTLSGLFERLRASNRTELISHAAKLHLLERDD
jgi:DNA-binding NarL/FixJ family response regulator